MIKQKDIVMIHDLKRRRSASRDRPRGEPRPEARAQLQDLTAFDQESDHT